MYKTFYNIKPHFKIHIKVAIIMGENWDNANGDRVEIILDNSIIHT